MKERKITSVMFHGSLTPDSWTHRFYMDHTDDYVELSNEEFEKLRPSYGDTVIIGRGFLGIKPQSSKESANK